MMEKGSFHTSPEANPTAITDELVKNIPLPNQLPKGVSFKDIPASAMKSSTLESLISQNEDLMARLSVSLRKANQFEEKAAVLEKENQGFRAKFETLHEQFMVLHEKDRIFSARSQQLLEENGASKEHRQKLEKVYSELYVQAQALQRRLQYLERYRVRIHKASPAIQERAKRLALLQTELEQTRAGFEQTRKTLSMAHMQAVNSYEVKLADCRHEIDTLKSKASERDQLFDEKVKLHNQLVFEQRQHGLMREDNATTIERLERENSDIRLQLKQALVTQEAQKSQINELSDRLPTLEEQNKALLEQVESLQALWAHKQRETDQLEEKNRSLQKLNQTLSVNLNQQRKDMQTLQSETDAERFQATDRIKILTAEIEMLRAQTIET